ncbi:alkaline phosphatase family protein [Jatrophihabitans sp.]|jgi:acid phosphatase|uniref:alkaline phosphatase family protein n=1 Tax=Jatrophihabitans sp. TaxID=1932789 RepID=UPI002EF4E334
MPRAIGFAALLAALLTVAGCGAGTSKSARTVASPAGSSTTASSATGSPATGTGAIGTASSGTAAQSGTASSGTAAQSGTAARTGPATAVPRFDHIVVVVLENHAYSQIIGRSSAPFLNSLADRGAVLTRSHGITYPSQPNYLAMFSGSTQGLTDNSCPHNFTGPNLAAALLAAGHSFVGYSEDLPATGFTGCGSGAYARKHNPWVNFGELPTTVNQPLTAFPGDLSRLPEVSFVIPNLDNDMHDGTVAEGDRWLRAHLGAYADWSTAHNSLLIVTADEDDKSHDNRIATIVTGAQVRPGRYSVRTDHYGLLATLLAGYGLTPFGEAARAQPITTIWSR